MFIQILLKQFPLDLGAGSVPENVVGIGIFLSKFPYLFVPNAEILGGLLHTQGVLPPNRDVAIIKSFFPSLHPGSAGNRVFV